MPMQISISNAIGGGGGAQGGGSSFENTQSIETDGIDAHVSIPSYTSIDARNTFSISCWIKMPSGGGGGLMGKNRTTSYNSQRFRYQLTESSVQIFCGNIAFCIHTSISVNPAPNSQPQVDSTSHAITFYLFRNPRPDWAAAFKHITLDVSPLCSSTRLSAPVCRFLYLCDFSACRLLL